MLFLHETHKVVGARHDEFEAAYREGWMPTLAKQDTISQHRHMRSRTDSYLFNMIVFDANVFKMSNLRQHGI